MPNFNWPYYNTTIHEIIQDERRREEEIEEVRKRQEQIRSNIMPKHDVQAVD